MRIRTWPLSALALGVLHLLVASLEPVALEFLHALLAHPSVNCNVQDAESGAWRWHAARAY